MAQCKILLKLNATLINPITGDSQPVHLSELPVVINYQQHRLVVADYKQVKSSLPVAGPSKTNFKEDKAKPDEIQVSETDESVTDPFDTAYMYLSSGEESS